MMSAINIVVNKTKYHCLHRATSLWQGLYSNELLDCVDIGTLYKYLRIIMSLLNMASQLTHIVNFVGKSSLLKQ